MVLYPWISNYMNDRMEKSTIEAYKDEIEGKSEKEKEAILKEARGYNKALVKANIQLTDPFQEQIQGDVYPYRYSKLLNLSKTGVMGVVDIPCINVNLPIYHGTSDEVLMKGVGHLKGSSLPVGGDTTHAVLTGHTGMSSAKLFTDLEQMKKGDLFFIETCGIKLAYKVVRIDVVLPDNTEGLRIVKGKDLVTLVTCTPYGINSHRLLVRGERTDYVEGMEDSVKKHPVSESQWMKAYRNAAIIGIILVIIIIIIVRQIRKRKNKLKN